MARDLSPATLTDARGNVANDKEATPEPRVTTFFPEVVKGRSRGQRDEPKSSPIDQGGNGLRILELLREKWEAKENGTFPEESGSLRETIEGIRHESDSIQTVRKERVFDDDVTEEEMSIIQQRVALQQRQFQEYQRREAVRKSSKIRSMFDFLRREEIEEALVEAKDDEDAVILNFAQPHYLMKLRKAIALKYRAEDAEVNLTEEQQQAYDRRVEKRKQAPKKTTTEDAKKRCIRFSRLRLDEALSQLENGGDPSKVFEGWSDARVRAYQQIKTKPNSYYYRFNAPGEKQRNGVWTKVRSDDMYLVFHAVPDSLSIYFRKNELCSSIVWKKWEQMANGESSRWPSLVALDIRHLLKSGEVIDENYTIDAKGELRYLFGKKEGGQGVIRNHSKHGSGGIKGSGGVKATRSVTTVKKRKRKNADDDDEDDDGNVDDLFDEDDSGTYTCKVSWATTRRTRARVAAEESEGTLNEGEENPLPGFTDPITLDEVVKPAISPYGHVMSYNSWIRCLSSEDRKNICPLTKKPLTKRELVVLTFENIEEYRDRIVNS
ncbi:hypothetical protein PhCBS80983_g03128 [Powellomyces hirtus]|uniref:Uncharacterized protein n=1 Tax=Powellomyces hirtus TaxID=109895 RepID=A0A507E2Y6_9FUNG|nr:hypothetical protein PhCBS80983_g03128 [Powellomyces hirtus]